MNSILLTCMIALISLGAVAQTKTEPPVTTWDHLLCESLKRTMVNSYRLDDVLKALKKGANPNVDCPSYFEWTNTALNLAVEYFDLKMVKALVEKGADLNKISDVKEPWGTPLFYANWKHKFDITYYLLIQGAKPSSEDFNLLVTDCLETNEKLNLLETILTKNPSVVNIQHAGKNFLGTACRLSTVNLLLAHGADKNARSIDGDSVLHTQAAEIVTPGYENEHNKVVELLISLGLSADEVTTEGNSLLHLAAAARNPGLVNLLMYQYHLDPNDQNLKKENVYVSMILREMQIINQSPSSYSKIHPKYLEVARALVPHMRDLRFRIDGNTLLLKALKVGDETFAEFLLSLDKDLDINFKDSEGGTATFYAARNNYSLVLQQLLSKGAFLTGEDKFGNGILHVAVETSNLSNILKFLDLGMKVNKQNKAGQTPLVAAVKNKKPSVMLILLERKACTNIVDGFGKTILAYALETKSEEIIEMVKQYSKKPENNCQPDV